MYTLIYTDLRGFVSVDDSVGDGVEDSVDDSVDDRVDRARRTRGRVACIPIGPCS